MINFPTSGVRKIVPKWLNDIKISNNVKIFFENIIVIFIMYFLFIEPYYFYCTHVKMRKYIHERKRKYIVVKNL